MRSRSIFLILLLSSAFCPLGCGWAHPRAAGPPTTSATAAPVDADPVVGAVFLGASDLHTCSGAVLHSRTGDLILTAAHCLSSNLPTTFAPGFGGQAGSAGVWTVDTVYLDPRWVASQDPAADYAIARVSGPLGRSVETVVGTGLSLGTAPAPGTVVTVAGYPMDTGAHPIGCRATTAITPTGFPSVLCSGLSDGTSGAAWRAGSTAVALIGGPDGGGCDDKVSYSPRFDSRIVDLLRRAEGGGPGDFAPEAYANDC
jgi:hypothetical protein